MERQTTLDADELHSRLKLDYEVVKLMRSPLMIAEAYRNVDDLRACRDPIVSNTEGHLATHYRVDYHIRTLIGRGRYSNKTTVHFDLFANDDYPFAEPSGFVIDSDIPWSPHFSDTDGWVCIGKIWEHAHGNLLLGQLLVHVAKLLNFDEPEYPEEDYGGFSPEAVEYWESEFDRQPLTKNLPYPPLPELVSPLPAQEESPPKTLFKKKGITGTPAPAIKLRTGVRVAGSAARIRFRTPGGVE